MSPTTTQKVDIDFVKLLKEHMISNNEIVTHIKFLKDIISNLNIAIFIHDMEKQRHIWTNNNYYGIIGYTDEEIKTFSPEWMKKNYHPEDIHLIKERYDYILQNKGNTYSGVYRVKHKKGQWVWVYQNVTVYKRDEKGNPQQVLGISIDFSDNFKTTKQFKTLYQENLQLKNELKISKLTKREKEVLKLIAQGRTSQEIAKTFHISKSTADNHRKHMLKKLKLHNIADLTRFATETGLA